MTIRLKLAQMTQVARVRTMALLRALGARTGAAALQRRAHVAYPLATLAALGLSSVAVYWGHHALTSAYFEREMARGARRDAAERLTQLNRQAAAVRASRALLGEAEAAGFGPGQWGLRRMDIRQATMSRESVNRLLSQIARTPSQMFGAEEFELSMKSATGGLFETPVSGSDASLLVTLSGTLYFRLGAS
ncbi:hypothetical protein LGM43_35590 [Burkholderia seminalis]|uniref:hypothetical protein n=1 Tax=Burkholderia seminalis TaxID=488731 RepID=UPI001CF3DE0A|nr:hypothetical protein [Burkholderia seminalis]MCA7955581.1 hypothetical protein [Burkholderia seminalis]